MKLHLTESGKALLVSGLGGDRITFTKASYGSGKAECEPYKATELANPIITTAFADKKVNITDGYVEFPVRFSNFGITEGFRITEAGYFAKNETAKTDEILYAYGVSDEETADYVPPYSERDLSFAMNVSLFVSEAANITVTVGKEKIYATREDFDAHKNDKSNPHEVTKEQVGLGKVENKEPSELAPAFDEKMIITTQFDDGTSDWAKVLYPRSGEPLKTLFQKIFTLFKKVDSHFTDKNPHKVTAEQTGAAEKKHKHSALDITSGILPTERGGTGKGSISELAASMAESGKFLRLRTEQMQCTQTGHGYTQSFDFGIRPKVFFIIANDGDTACFAPTSAQTHSFTATGTTVKIEWGQASVRVTVTVSSGTRLLHFVAFY